MRQTVQFYRARREIAPLLWALPLVARQGPAQEEKSGAQGRIRTADTAIFNRMLYQLSYLGTGRAL